MSEELNHETPAPTRSHVTKIGIFFSLLAIVILIGMFAFGYMQLAKVNHSFSSMVAELQTASTKDNDDIAALQQSVEKLTDNIEKSADFSKEQEKLLAEWREAQKGNLGKWQVAEAQYLTKLANDQIQFTQNISLAVLLLNRASAELTTVADGASLNQAIQGNLAELQKVTPLAMTPLYEKLVELDNKIDQLPIPTLPLKATLQQSNDALPESWWKVGLHHSWDMLKQVIVVRYNDENVLPFINPDEKIFFYQNLHAELQSAIWGLLHREPKVFQTSLTRASTWIKKYFVVDDPLTKSMIQAIAEMQSTDFTPVTVDLSNTLTLFDQYFRASSPQSVTQ